MDVQRALACCRKNKGGTYARVCTRSERRGMEWILVKLFKEKWPMAWLRSREARQATDKGACRLLAHFFFRAPCSLLLSLKLLDVKVEFSALKDVAIETARLSGAGGDSGENVSRVELVSESLLNLAISLSAGEHGLVVATSLSLSAGFIRFFNLLLVELNIVVLQVPQSEGSGIDFHNSVLDKSLGTDELVVGSVVDDVQNTGLTADSLRAPGEVSSVNAERALLDIATTSTNMDKFLGAKLGHSGHSTHFELPFFLVNRHAATSGPPLVPGVPRNTHTS